MERNLETEGGATKRKVLHLKTIPSLLTQTQLKAVGGKLVGKKKKKRVHG